MMLNRNLFNDINICCVLLNAYLNNSVKQILHKKVNYNLMTFNIIIIEDYYQWWGQKMISILKCIQNILFL